MISKFSQYFYRLFGLFLLFFNLNSWAVDYPKAPDPFYYVNDYTNTLSSQEWRTLENALIENRNKTSSQIIVAIIPTTQGEEIAQYATNLFNKWGIGRTKHNENNGVLLLVAKNDRKLFIATGRGIEGALPDMIASSIIRHNITPYFKQEHYAEGIASGLSAIMAAINGEYAAYDSYSEEQQPFDDIEGLLFFLGMGLVIFVIFYPRGNSRYVSPSTLDQLGREMMRASRSNNGFGGGFSGSFGSGSRGSGDSFGGGSSGGGGAGGSW